jgi:hypothetical protein
MPSDERAPFEGYLLGVLADGARPFLYRTNVRTLLGVPKADSDYPVFSPMLPPVGFKYAARDTSFFHNAGTPSLEQDPDEPTAVAGASINDNGRTQLVNASLEKGGEWDFTDTMVPWPTAIPKSPGPSEQTLVRDSASPGGQDLMPRRKERAVAWPDTNPDPIALLKHASETRVEKDGQPAQAQTAPNSSERTLVEIPGVSEERLSFSALQTIAPDSEHPARPSTSEPNRPTEVTSNKSTRYKHTPRGTKSAQPIAPEERSNTDSDTLPRYRHGVSRLLGHDPKRPAGQIIGDSSPLDFERRAAPELGLRPGRAASISTDGTDQPSAAQTVGIDKLRHAVHCLASKASLPEDTADERPPRRVERALSAPSPAQPVIVVKRPPAGRKAPRAFWERCYLGRFRLEILR